MNALVKLPGMTAASPASSLPPRFVTWRAVSKPDGKIDKVPLDLAGNRSDCNSPTNWLGYPEAVATGRPIGFVFNGDGYVGIDPDACRNAETGDWHPDALALFQKFVGAMVEVSQSGRGGHIIGKIDNPDEYAAKGSVSFNGLPRVDWFNRTGFIAFGPHGWRHNPHADITQAFGEVVTKTEQAEGVGLSTAGDPRWTLGHMSDDEIISKMLASKGSINAQFGDKATVAELWTAEPVALAKHFPHDSQPYDRSQAHMSLMAHLAYWFGRTPSRMAEAFRKSKMAEDGKWDRKSYRTATVANALKTAGNVYDKAASIVRLPGIGAMHRGASRLLTADDLIERYAFCTGRNAGSAIVPIETSDAAAGMSFEHFKKMMKKHDAGGHNPADVWLARPERVDVYDLRMRPDMERPTYSESGQWFINTYRPPVHDAEGGSVEPFLRFLAHLVPNEIERQWLMRWLAYKFRNPAIPGSGIVMIADGKFGTGRGTLKKVIERLFGARYVKSNTFTELAGETYQSQYNDWLAEAVIVFIDEAVSEAAGKRGGAGRRVYDKLKEVVAPDTRNMRFTRKGLPSFDGPCFASVVIATNHADAFSIPENDRRFAVLSNGERMSQADASAIHAWMREDSNIAALARHLQALELGEYDPFAPVIETDAKSVMVFAGRTDLEQIVEDVIADFPGDLFAAEQVEAAMHGRTDDLPSSWRSLVRRIVRNNYPIVRGQVKHGQDNRIRVNNRRFNVFGRSEMAAKEWRRTDDASAIKAEVLKIGWIYEVPEIRAG